MVFDSNHCTAQGCPEPALCQRLKRHMRGPLYEQWKAARRKVAPPRAMSFVSHPVAATQRTKPVEKTPQGPPSKDMNPEALAELKRGQCRHLGAVLPGQPCGSTLRRCLFDGITCARLRACDQAARVCATCPHHSPLTTFEQGATGMGDVLLGLLAVAGYKAAHPEETIHYRVSTSGLPWAALFEGYDRASGGAKEHNEKAVAGAHQVNLGYDREMTTKFAKSRIERYCRNIGTPSPIIPALRDPEKIRRLGIESLKLRVEKEDSDSQLSTRCAGSLCFEVGLADPRVFAYRLAGVGVAVT